MLSTDYRPLLPNKEWLGFDTREENTTTIVTHWCEKQAPSNTLIIHIGDGFLQVEGGLISWHKMGKTDGKGWEGKRGWCSIGGGVDGLMLLWIDDGFADCRWIFHALENPYLLNGSFLVKFWIPSLWSFGFLSCEALGSFLMKLLVFFLVKSFKNLTVNVIM